MLQMQVGEKCTDEHKVEKNGKNVVQDHTADEQQEQTKCAQNQQRNVVSKQCKPDDAGQQQRTGQE